MGMSFCKKCGSADGREMRLFGGYNTRLCFSCQNEFDQFIHPLPVWMEALSIHARKIEFALAKGKSADTAQMILFDQNQNEMVAFEIAQTWVEEKKEGTTQ